MDLIRINNNDECGVQVGEPGLIQTLTDEGQKE